MRIVVKSNGGPDLRLPIPSGLVLNRFVAANCLKKYGLGVTKKRAAVFVRELKRYRRSHPEWVLVEVRSPNGDHVEIKL